MPDISLPVAGDRPHRLLQLQEGPGDAAPQVSRCAEDGIIGTPFEWLPAIPRMPSLRPSSPAARGAGPGCQTPRYGPGCQTPRYGRHRGARHLVTSSKLGQVGFNVRAGPRGPSGLRARPGRLPGVRVERAQSRRISGPSAVLGRSWAHARQRDEARTSRSKSPPPRLPAGARPGVADDRRRGEQSPQETGTSSRKVQEFVPTAGAVDDLRRMGTRLRRLDDRPDGQRHQGDCDHRVGDGSRDRLGTLGLIAMRRRGGRRRRAPGEDERAAGIPGQEQRDQGAQSPGGTSPLPSRISLHPRPRLSNWRRPR